MVGDPGRQQFLEVFLPSPPTSPATEVVAAAAASTVVSRVSVNMREVHSVEPREQLVADTSYGMVAATAWELTVLT